MFDPAIYDNLKIVLEGAVYDLDMEGRLKIVSRNDIVDLSSVSRQFSIGFRSDPGAPALAELTLSVSLSDLAAELLNGETKDAGCMLEIIYYTASRNPDSLCAAIQKQMQADWDGRPTIKQTITTEYGSKDPHHEITVFLSFGRKLNEQHAADLPLLVQHTLASLEWLTERIAVD